MRVMDVLLRIKKGERVMVTLGSQEGHKKSYSLSDGTPVSREQFCKIKPFLSVADVGLIASEPQSYQWAG